MQLLSYLVINNYSTLDSITRLKVGLRISSLNTLYKIKKDDNLGST